MRILNRTKLISSTLLVIFYSITVVTYLQALTPDLICKTLDGMTESCECEPSPNSTYEFSCEVDNKPLCPGPDPAFCQIEEGQTLTVCGCKMPPPPGQDHIAAIMGTLACPELVKQSEADYFPVFLLLAEGVMDAYGYFEIALSNAPGKLFIDTPGLLNSPAEYSFTTDEFGRVNNLSYVKGDPLLNTTQVNSIASNNLFLLPKDSQLRIEVLDPKTSLVAYSGSINPLLYAQYSYVSQIVMAPVIAIELDLDGNQRQYKVLEQQFVSLPCENVQPSPSPSPSASPSASMQPSASASPSASMQPSSSASPMPSASASQAPSASASVMPSASSIPSSSPKASASSFPKPSSSALPSSTPSAKPSIAPSTAPSSTPSPAPSIKPSSTPSAAPSVAPSINPSSTPSSMPSAVPTVRPSNAPSAAPSVKPSVAPSIMPSTTPSAQPSEKPSTAPSTAPTVRPSSQPSPQPSVVQPEASQAPSAIPSPSKQPPTEEPCKNSTEFFDEARSVDNQIKRLGIEGQKLDFQVARMHSRLGNEQLARQHRESGRTAAALGIEGWETVWLKTGVSSVCKSVTKTCIKTDSNVGLIRLAEIHQTLQQMAKRGLNELSKLRGQDARASKALKRRTKRINQRDNMAAQALKELSSALNLPIC